MQAESTAAVGANGGVPGAGGRSTSAGADLLRHSYSGLPAAPHFQQAQAQAQAGGGSSEALEAALASAKDTWAQERAQLEATSRKYVCPAPVFVSVSGSISYLEKHVLTHTKFTLSLTGI